MAQEELAWRESATARLLEARKKNGRLGSKKSRSGCRTCKTRHIKCDEQKPECGRCRSTGRKCDGYVDSPSPKANVKKDSSSLIASQPSQFLGINPDNRRAFDFFLSRAGPRLSGPLDKEFWCGHVLQLAQAEPSIVESILAISTLYEHPQFMNSFRGDDSAVGKRPHGNILSPPDEYHVDALRHYSKAMRGLQQRIEDGTVTPLLALLSCVLFLCTELMRDDIGAAFLLYARGAALLRQFASDVAAEKHRGPLTLIKLIFVRVGVLCSTFGHIIPTDEQPEVVVSEQYDTFHSMADARTALYAVMTDSDEFVKTAKAWKESLIMDAEAQDTSPHKTVSTGEPIEGLEMCYGINYRQTNEVGIVGKVSE